MGQILQVRNLSKSFGKKEVLKNISLEIQKGEIFGIVGGSGVGKTVLLKTLIGFIKPNKGIILFEDVDIHQRLNYIRKNFGFSTQEHCFYPELSVKENINYFGKIYKVKSNELKRSSEIFLKLLELEEYRNIVAKNLSGGTQRKLDISCAMIHSPKILLLDEPLSGLDPILRKKIIKILKEINKLGVTIVISSHYLEELEDFCTRILILDKGNVVSCDTPRNIIDKYANYFIINIISEPGDYNKILTSLNSNNIKLINWEITTNGLNLYVPKNQDKLMFYKILNLISKSGETIKSINYNLPRLNEIFEKLMVH